MHIQHRKLIAATALLRLQHQCQCLRTILGARHLHTPALQLLFEDTAIGLVIVHHQYAHVGKPGGGRRCIAGFTRDRQAQADTEFRAAARFAVNANGARHRPQQTPTNGEAQTGTAVLTRSGAVSLRKVIENLFLGFVGDTDAGIFNAKFDCGIAIGIAARANGDANDHLAFAGEFDRIADQIGDHLPQSERIAAKCQRCIGRNVLRRQLEPLGFCGAHKHRQRIFNHCRKIEVDFLKLEIARFDP